MRSRMYASNDVHFHLMRNKCIQHSWFLVLKHYTTVFRLTQKYARVKMETENIVFAWMVWIVSRELGPGKWVLCGKPLDVPQNQLWWFFKMVLMSYNLIQGSEIQYRHDHWKLRIMLYRPTKNLWKSTAFLYTHVFCANFTYSPCTVIIRCLSSFPKQRFSFEFQTFSVPKSIRFRF